MSQELRIIRSLRTQIQLFYLTATPGAPRKVRGHCGFAEVCLLSSLTVVFLLLQWPNEPNPDEWNAFSDEETAGFVWKDAGRFDTRDVSSNKPKHLGTVVFTSVRISEEFCPFTTMNHPGL